MPAIKTDQDIIIPTSLEAYLETISAIIRKAFNITGAAAPDQNFPFVFRQAANKEVNIIKIK